MTTKIKPVEALQPSDFQTYPVWQFVNNDAAGETVVRPVARLPVTSMANKIVGVQVALSNGISLWALIGNIDSKSPRMTEHFITVSFYIKSAWFHLARYHDFDYESRGPVVLAKVLGQSVDEVFPIAYDISKYAKGDIQSLSGVILKEPRERLTRAEIIAMAVP